MKKPVHKVHFGYQLYTLTAGFPKLFFERIL